MSEGPDLLLDKPILLLGRHQECDVQLNSRKISRRHCCIAQIDNQLVVRDLGSTNGIRINGVRVVEGYLKAGDQLTVGNYQYRVQWESQPPGRPPPAAALPVKRPEPAAARPARDDQNLSMEIPVALTDSGQVPHLKAQPREPAPEEKPLAQATPAKPDILPDDLSLAPISRIIHQVESGSDNPPAPSSV
jgi:predicted component of type VI protein secretion system